MADLTNLKVGDTVVSRNGGVSSIDSDFYFDDKWVFIHGIYFDVLTGLVGKATDDSPFDIVSIAPKPEPKRIKGWINLYDKNSCYQGIGDALYDTRKDADNNACKSRKACIEIDVAEGEGL